MFSDAASSRFVVTSGVDRARRDFVAGFAATVFESALVGSRSDSRARARDGSSANGGSWPFVFHDRRNSNWNPSASAVTTTPNVEWRLDVFDAPDPYGGPAFAPTPAILDGTVFVGGRTLSAHRVRDGTTRWEVRGRRDEAFGGVGVSSDGVYAPSTRGTDYSLNAFTRTGERRWRRPLRTGEGRAPVVTDRTVYCPTQFALEAYGRKAGAKRWEYETDWGLGFPPAVTDRRLVVSDGYSGLAVKKRRRSFWRLLGSQPPETVWRHQTDVLVAPAPAIGERLVFAPRSYFPHLSRTDEGGLTALTRTGEVVWQRSVDRGFATEPVVGDGRAFVKWNVYPESRDSGAWRTSSALLAAHRASDGRELWRRKFPVAGGGFRSPILVGSTLYVPLYDARREAGRVLGVDANTGETRWSRSFPSLVFHLAAVGERVFVSTEGGRLYALR